MATIGKIDEIQEFTIEWRIPDFSSLPKRENVHYESPLFRFANASWYLSIYPNGHTSNDTVGYIGLYLTRKSPGLPINLEYSLGLKTLKGEKDLLEDHSYVFEEEEDGYGSIECLLRSKLLERKSDLLPSDVLTVICTVKYPKSTGDTRCSYCKEALDADCISMHEKKCLDKPIKCPDCCDVIVLQNWYNHECQVKKTEGETSKQQSTVVINENKVLHDLKELFFSSEDCDVAIYVKGEKFQAHKAILKARSPVFGSAFRNDMKEKATGIIDIEDCDPTYFSDFLCFLYCGDEEILSTKNVFSLFETADKYDVQDLRSKCVEFMKDNLSTDTFCDTIALALQYSETELIKFSTDFFVEDAQNVIMTVQWQSFIVENPTYSNELFIKALACAKSSNI